MVTPGERLLAVLGTRGRTVASRIDLARSIGPASTWRRLRHGPGRLGPGARNAVYRRIWSEAAAELDAGFSDLGSGFYEIARNGSSTRVFQQVTAIDDEVTLRVALTKPVVHRLLTEARAPVPEHLEFEFGAFGPAREFLRANGACVVKPASGTAGGDGITAGVATDESLWRAGLVASRYDSRLLIERQAEGPVYRVLLLDGEVLDVVRQRPPRLTGDGRRSVEALVAAENARRLAAGGEAGLSLLYVDLDAVLTLRRQRLRPSSVLPAGTTVELKTVTNDGRLEDRERYDGPLSHELITAARTAVDALGLRLGGVDVITSDPGRPLGETRGVITDVNGTPGIHHHYLVANRSTANPVAVPILRRLLGEAPHRSAG
jgi:cyanophycin synthetase